VALAAGKLMKLPPAQLAQAVSLAINDHIPMAQTRVQALSDWKGLADAEAGRKRRVRALLARAGLTGPAPIFEGNSGFFKQISGPADVDVAAFGRRGCRFESTNADQGLSGRGLRADRGRGRHRGRQENGPPRPHRGDRNRDDEARLPARRERSPRSGRRTRGRPPITACPISPRAPLFDGDIRTDSYLPAKLREPASSPSCAKIHGGKEDPALTARVGAMVRRGVTAILATGSGISSESTTCRVSRRPMTRAEVERKFRGKR